MLMGLTEMQTNTTLEKIRSHKPKQAYNATIKHKANKPKHDSNKRNWA